MQASCHMRSVGAGAPMHIGVPEVRRDGESMQPVATANDPILDDLIREAVGDPETVGLLLSGSRAANMATPTSDYDLYWVLFDSEYDRRKVPGVPLRDRREPPDQPAIDLVYVCQRDLDRLPTAPGWWTYGYATARVLVDKTGDVTRAIAAITTMTEEKSRADVVGWFDAYANALVRSIEAGQRGNELGAPPRRRFGGASRPCAVRVGATLDVVSRSTHTAVVWARRARLARRLPPRHAPGGAHHG
jgi:hypothetical protein